MNGSPKLSEYSPVQYNRYIARIFNYSILCPNTYRKLVKQVKQLGSLDLC